MRWPWSSHSDNDRPPLSWNDSLNGIDWQHYKEPKNIFASIVIAAGVLSTVRIYKDFVRRIPTTTFIKPGQFRKRSLFGRVTRVGDADGFHLFHTPGGRLTGWGWLPGRKVPVNRKELVGKTISVRLAGVDAPELAHFGQEGQPYAKEAHRWLTEYISGRRVRAYIHSRDQYQRVIATVYIRQWGMRKDVGLEMLKRGLATVYEAKTGAEFGGLEDLYKATAEEARQRKVGMWEKPGILARFLGAKEKKAESPREYKDRMKEQRPQT